MIDEICDDVVALYESLRVPDGPLRNFQAVQKGNRPPDTAFHPCLTVDWDGRAEMKLEGNRAVTKFRFAVVVFSSTLAGFVQGASEHRRLLCHLAGDGKIIGLLPATVRLLTGYQMESGISFVIKPLGELKSYAAKKGTHASFYSILQLDFETWLNPSQILS